MSRLVDVQAASRETLTEPELVPAAGPRRRAGRKLIDEAASPREPRSDDDAAVEDEDRPLVTLRSGARGRMEIQLPASPVFRALAAEWNYRLRNRRRWTSDDGARAAVADVALEALLSLGIERRRLRRLLHERRIEVELHPPPPPSRATAMFDAASSVPWEYLLSAARRSQGGYHALVVSRLFRAERTDAGAVPPQAKGARPKAGGPRSDDSRDAKALFFIESAPGRLRNDWDFDSERRRLESAVQPGTRFVVSSTETVTEIGETIAQLGSSPRDIHVTGIDPHQMAQEYPDSRRAKEDVEDGMVLREVDQPELLVSYTTLAELLAGPSRPARVVTLNLCYSATRTALECVRQGAGAAIGILDEIDDSLAEYFFQAFYRELSRSESVIDAFEVAWEQLARTAGDGLRGTGIVLWTQVSVFQAGAHEPVAGGAAAAAAVAQALGARSSARDLHVTLEAPGEVNYSLLHNDRPLLENLTLDHTGTGSIEDVFVSVELHMGDQCYPYRKTIPLLSETMTELAPDVRIPLTGVLPRSLKERVQTTLHAKVTCGGRTAFEDTRRVTLLPVDEWLDDTKSNPWLPSFVLPRDPSIKDIIRRARRYLIAICDDPAAGFDGYQSVEDYGTEVVDWQVQAIWTALTHEYRLQYINPPPSYSRHTQRLRTPTDIVGSNSGTCVDLALLLASCLEYVGIFPVVVLLEGHAFAGYWRSEEAHDSYRQVLRIPAPVPAKMRHWWKTLGEESYEGFDWRLTRQGFLEILEYLRADELAFLEATYLTSAKSFGDALDEGAANLVSKDEFDSLLDVQLARTAVPPVTPLPVLAAAATIDEGEER